MIIRLILLLLLLLPKSAFAVQALGNTYGGTIIQRGLASVDGSGNVSATYPTPYQNAPYCFYSVIGTNSSYAFTIYPNTPTITGFTASVLAALKSPTLSLGLFVLWGPPPSGTSVFWSCISPTG